MYSKTDDGLIQELNCRNLISYVPSDKFLYNSTIKKNILMSNPLDEKRLQQVLKWSNIRSVIDKLEGGINYNVSEAGDNLSMGQQQRIAIARALYSNKPIIILDEPTANLDPDAKNLFWNTINTISEQRIVIIVTHDTSMIEHCQCSYRLQNGILTQNITV